MIGGGVFSRREVVNWFLSFQFSLKDITFPIKLSTGKACSSSFHLRLLSLFAVFFLYGLLFARELFFDEKTDLFIIFRQCSYRSLLIPPPFGIRSRKRFNFTFSPGLVHFSFEQVANCFSSRRGFSIPRFLLLREGKATDDDMQSIASLMSMPGFSDVGRMEDLDDMDGELNEEDEDRAQAEERDNEFRETMGKFSELSKK